MRRSTLSLAIMVLTTFLLFYACKKTEPTSARMMPEQHQMEQLKKSFEDSKKVIVAKVNGDPITMFTLLREMNVIAEQYIKPGQQRTPEIDSKVKTAALNDLIFQELAIQEARKGGMTVNAEVINGEINNIKAKEGDEKSFQGYLAMNGLSEEELRQMIERDQLFEMIATKEVDAKIRITDAALRERYKKEKSHLMTKNAAHKQMTYEEARGMLEQGLRAEAGVKRMREWQKELRKNAKIEIMEQNQQKG